MSLRPHCICKHEIVNGLPRTKHCLVPCSDNDETCEECGKDWNTREYSNCPQCFPPSNRRDDYNPTFGDLDDDFFSSEDD
jgi:predicted amidophosphoribosyltransferase